MEAIDPESLRVVKHDRRHVIVAQLRFATGIASISFSGVTQGPMVPDRDRFDYPHLASLCATIIQGSVGIQLDGMIIRPSIEYLLAHAKDEVSELRRKIRRSDGGRIVVDSQLTGLDTSDFLVGSLALSDTPEHMRSAPERNTAEETLLDWKKLGVKTRVRYHENAPELLFIWQRAASSSHLELIISALLRASSTFSRDPEGAVKHVMDLKPGTVFRLSDVMQRFSLTREQAARLLGRLVTENVLAMRYRVNTTKILLGYSNQWVDDLAQMPFSVQTEDDKVLEIDSPGKVELGFERVSLP